MCRFTEKRTQAKYFNQAFERGTGCVRDELLGRHPGLLRSWLHDKTFYGKPGNAIHRQAWEGWLHVIG